MKKKIITGLILILIALPTLLPFFNAKFFYTQDYIFIARLQQLNTALMDGNFPVRWAPDLRYGEPLFNYYAPLPYYLGAIVRVLGFNTVWVAKILFILATIFSAITMYIFCRELSSKTGAFFAAILYTYAPYRAVDLYVRGALSEIWAFVFFPLIFYASLLLSKKINFKRIFLLSLSMAGLFLSHNVTSLMFLPFLSFWWMYLVFKQRSWKLIFSFAGSFIWALGISAFFLMPALLERQFIQTKYLTVGYFNFRAHFVAFKQFFSLFWGYGSSLWGPNDGLSFQVGLVNWATLIITFATGLFFKKNRKLLGILSFLGLSFMISIFLQHNKSAFIWEAIPLMAFIQFPWRFLAISVFLVPIAGAIMASYFKKRLSAVVFILGFSAMLLSFQYFHPKEYVDDTFFEKFLNPETMRRGVDLTKDYLPIWVLTVDGPMLNYPKADKGKIDVSKFGKKGINAESNVKVLSDSLIEIPITYFPGWEVKANNQLIPQIEPSEMGLIRFKLPKGDYNIAVEFKDTLIRIFGNMISLMSTFLILVILMYERYKLR